MRGGLRRVSQRQSPRFRTSPLDQREEMKAAQISWNEGEAVGVMYFVGVVRRAYVAQKEV